MTNDDPSRTPEERDRREAVREKAQQVQAQQTRARMARRVTAVALVGVVVVAGALAVSWALVSQASAPQLRPANDTGGGFPVTSVAGVASDVAAGVDDGQAPMAATEPAPATAEPTATPTAAPTVDIRVYVDYLAAGARDFQLANVQQLSTWVTKDVATLTYYPVAMLSAKSNGTKYSLRAASAAACVASYSPDSFFAFNNALLAQQPELDTDGLTDAELADIAQATGAAEPKAVRECIEDEAFAAWVRDATDTALAGIPDTDDVTLTGTPMVLVNGAPYVGALDDPAEFAQFVLTVSSDAYYDATPTPTPTSTPTPVPSETPAG